MKGILYALLIVFLSACANNSGKTREEKINYILEKAFEDQEFIGTVLVADQGQVIYKKSFGEADAARGIANTDTTRFLLASVSKPITAVLMLRLVDKKLIGLEDRMDRYFKVSNPRVGAITIHQLLTHTSGLSEIIDKSPNPDINASVEKASLNFEPGSSFEYSNSAYVLLGRIASVVAQKSFPQLVREEIFDVAGMSSSGVARNSDTTMLARGYADATQKHPVPIDFPLKNVDGAGSIYSTVEDLYKFERALYTETLISNRMRDQMLKQHVPEKYSYGWYVRERGGSWDVYWHQGDLPGVTTYISRRVQKDQCVILLANAEHLDLKGLENDIAKILKTSE